MAPAGLGYQAVQRFEGAREDEERQADRNAEAVPRLVLDAQPGVDANALGHRLVAPPRRARLGEEQGAGAARAAEAPRAQVDHVPMAVADWVRAELAAGGLGAGAGRTGVAGQCAQAHRLGSGNATR